MPNIHTIYSGSIADGWHCTTYKILNNTCSQRFSLSFHLYRSLCVLLMSNAYTYPTYTWAQTLTHTHTLRSMAWCYAKAHISVKHRVKYTRTAQPQPLTRLRLAVKPNRFQWRQKNTEKTPTTTATTTYDRMEMRQSGEWQRVRNKNNTAKEMWCRGENGKREKQQPS